MTGQRLYLLFSVFIGICFFTGLAQADFESVAEDGQFSCIIAADEVFKPYALGKSINVYVDFQHKLEEDLILPDGLKQSDVFSFGIEDEQGNQISMCQHLTNDKDFAYSRIEPGRKVGTCIDIGDWHEILDAGTYTLQAKWQIDTGQQSYSGTSNKVNIKVVSPEDKDVFDLTWEAVQPRAAEGYGPAYYKLVEIGPRAVPILLEWLRMQENGQIPTDELNESDVVIDILSRIGTTEAYEIITNYNGIDERHRDILLKYVKIWQSDNRYERLMEAFEDPKISKKWVIFKLGVLGDKRAMEILEQIALNDKHMDIRETAKDAINHLRDPSITMRYLMHRHSESIELQTSKDQYRIGEKIEITCVLTGGRYGSNKLVEYSSPKWHFLPWGRPHGAVSIFFLRMSMVGDKYPGVPGTPVMRSSVPGALNSKKPEPPYGMTERGEMIPVKELIDNKRHLEHGGFEPLEGYVELSDLGNVTYFTLHYGQTRVYKIEDLNKVFNITQAGKYTIYVHIRGKSSIRSNKVTIAILPAD